MEEGKELMWKFPEFDEKFPIKVGKIEKDKYISYFWGTDGNELLVEMTLSSKRKQFHFGYNNRKKQR